MDHTGIVNFLKTLNQFIGKDNVLPATYLFRQQTDRKVDGGAVSALLRRACDLYHVVASLYVNMLWGFMFSMYLDKACNHYYYCCCCFLIFSILLFLFLGRCGRKLKLQFKTSLQDLIKNKEIQQLQ